MSDRTTQLERQIDEFAERGLQATRNGLRFSAGPARRIVALVLLDVGLQAFLVVLGLALLFDPGAISDQVNLGSAPTWSDLIFALTLASVAFTSLESAAGLAGEIDVR